MNPQIMLQQFVSIKNQIEGCVLQIVSRALKEEVTFDRSGVTSLDWASYPILNFPEIPDVESSSLIGPQRNLGARVSHRRRWFRQRLQMPCSMQSGYGSSRCRSSGPRCGRRCRTLERSKAHPISGDNGRRAAGSAGRSGGNCGNARWPGQSWLDAWLRMLGRTATPSQRGCNLPARSWR